MSKKIAIDVTKETAITITNTFGTEDYEKYRVSVKSVGMLEDRLEGDMLATGAASLGDPHVDEYDQMNKVVVPETNAFDGLHAFSLRLFGGNQYITLLPGDSIKLMASGNAAVYYTMIKADGIKVEATGVITPGEDRATDEGPVFTDDGDETPLDRGTGVGDEASIKFDSEKVTDEMNKVVPKDEATAGSTDSEDHQSPGKAAEGTVEATE